jgi:hypothetical protein
MNAFIVLQADSLPWPVNRQQHREKIPTHEVQWLLKQQGEITATLKSIKTLCQNGNLLATYGELKWPALSFNERVFRIRGIMRKYRK